MATALTNMGASLPTPSALEDYETWGLTLNSTIQSIDRALGSRVAIATTGGTTALTDAQNDSAFIEITGTLASNAVIQTKERGRFWFMKNGTSGAYTVTVRIGAAGNSITLAQGKTGIIYQDGTTIQVIDLDSLSGSGGGGGGGGGPFTDSVTINGSAPALKLADTTSSAYDWWVQADANKLKILTDINSDGTADSTAALEIDHATQKLYLYGTELKTSGQDAGTLDGLDSTAFMRANADTSTSGKLTVDGGELLIDAANSGADAVIKLRNESGTAQVGIIWNRTNDRVDIIRYASDGTSSSGTLTMTDTILAYNGNTIWHGGNLSGSGSGVMADTLDGLDAADFMRATADAVTSGTLTVNGATVNIDAISADALLAFRNSSNTAQGWLWWKSSDDTFRIARVNAAGSAAEGEIVIGATTLTFNSNAVWHAGNDGAGSTLDADLLDGQQGAYYLDSANHTGAIGSARISGAYTGFTDITASGVITGSRLRLTATNDVGLASTLHGLQIGADNSANLAVDADEIQARNNGAATTLLLNPAGGSVTIGGSTVWHAGNDGSGSGLDADLVRGITPGATGLALLDDTSAAAARTTLGLGTAATLNTGTSSGNIPVLGTGGRLAAAQVPVQILSTSYESAEQTITQAGSLTLAHGLGARPKLVRYYLKCKTAEHGWAVNDEIDLTSLTQATQSSDRAWGLISWDDATNIYVRYGDNNIGQFFVYRRDTGYQVGATNANWRLIIRAYA